MIQVIFEEEALRELVMNGTTRDRKYKKLCKDARLVSNIQETVAFIEGTEDLKTLWQQRNGPLHYEQLKHDYAGKSSVRILHENHRQHSALRLIFTENEETITINLLELTDHYAAI